MGLSVLLACIVVIMTACSETGRLTSAERKYLFFAANIEQLHMGKYRHKETPEQVSYIFFKTYTEQFGFRSLYGTILVSPEGGEVKYLCLINILPTAGQARDLFEQMTPEPSPTYFGEEEAVDRRVYRADEAYLYRDDTYFHMILRSSRLVYTIMFEGANVEEEQVRKELRRKLAYLERNLDAIR